MKEEMKDGFKALCIAVCLVGVGSCINSVNQQDTDDRIEQLEQRCDSLQRQIDYMVE